MSARQHSPRTIRRALDVLLGLPPRALADLTERLVDRLDAIEPEADAEPDNDGEDGDEGEPDTEAQPDGSRQWLDVAEEATWP